MTGIAKTALLRVRGDAWTFPIRYEDAAGAGISLSAYTIDSVISWPGGSVGLETADVDLAAGRFTLTLGDNDDVPEGRTAKLFVRVVSVEGPKTLAIVPLHVSVP